MTQATTPPTTSVLGLGNMGAALAGALQDKGHKVTVWNRNPEKAHAQVEKGMRLAATPAVAVEDAEVVFICVSDLAACQAILHTNGLEAALRGRTLVQLTTMSPKDSLALSDWADHNGIGYLDGTIMGYPRHVREGSVKIYYSGPKALFQSCQPLLEVFGTAIHLGERPGTALVVDKIIYAQFYGIAFAYLHAAALGAAAGLPVETFIELTSGDEKWIGRGQMMKTFVDMAAKRDYAEVECALDVHAAAYQHVVALSEDLGVGSDFTQLVAKTMQAASKDGFGQGELAAMFEALMKPKKET